MVGAITGQLWLSGRSHERQKWGYVPPTNTNKGRHHKLDVGQILWQVGVF